ncbi:hypothetical protein OG422_30505 [Streptomyces sp. NBC_01525]
MLDYRTLLAEVTSLAEKLWAGGLGPGDRATGRPKGVGVTHRSATAFVDAEAALFLQDAPLGPGKTVTLRPGGGVRAPPPGPAVRS